MKQYTHEEKCYIWLSAVKGMTDARFFKLLKAANTVGEIWNEPDRFEHLLESRVFDELLKIHTPAHMDEIFARLEKHEITALTMLSPEYPDSLAEIASPPRVLFVKGSLELSHAKQFGIVGTRNPTYDGLKAAREVSAGLAENGVAIVSGLALGIDAAAHTACLDAGGRSIAVLGNGLNSVYPPQNEGLAQRILDSGGSLVSELMPAERASKWSFPRRNRIISALSAGIAVIEGSLRSGALITANCALDQGKDVFAVPGSPYSICAEGTNHLIQNGAYPLLSSWDIMEGMRWGARDDKNAPEAPPDLDETEQKVYDLLRREPLSVDEIQNVTGFSTQKLNSCLTMLTLKAIIVKQPGNIFRLV